MTIPASFRPQLAVPFTIIAEGDIVHLIGGEDLRYTVRAGEATVELVGLLHRCDGSARLDHLLEMIPADHQDTVRQLVERLASERVLVPGQPEQAVSGCSHWPVVEGRGPLCERLAIADADAVRADSMSVAVLCQDVLDYQTTLQFNHRCLQEQSPFWMWVTTGPAMRAYVSPVFVPDAGPCLACLIGQFERLSPVPQLYDALLRHGQQGGAFTPVAFPQTGLAILEQLVRWKINLLRMSPPPAAVFRLHVLELDTLEVQAHRVFADPLCRECADASRD